MADPDIQLFLRVVETGSFRTAAAEAKADPSSVTRRIAKLEERLGAKLLIRSSRRSRPTEAGQAYYDGIRRIADEQVALEAEIAGLADTPQGLLRVTAPADFGARFVTPVVDRLLSEHPDLSVELNLGSDFADLREANIDVAVRIGSLTDSALIARRFGEVPRAIVVAPSYLEAADPPRRPEDLVRHPFVFYRPAPEMTLHLARGEERVTVALSRYRVAVNSMSAFREFMLSGRGMVLSPLWACEDALADGRLVRVLPDWKSPAFPLHGVFLPGPFRPAKLRVFLEAMAAQAKADPSLSGA
ncbi:LysR family transcriptional regulator [Jannaschia sp. Os4]|uniref:LysR family transcriptional regulator n=1 Tax=Jannaschia sp. Os4 TaxID=2807617 RepID=UPI00193A87A6|nr:LysR family transcriptional regulator [Jannaschia sp. Os4]MBM2576407.1 LysR family transcriptional regulator [Jannaschia sp. Os4]